MRNISTALKAHLAQPYQTMCTCLQVILTNGTTYGFTDHDAPLVISGVTYASAPGITISTIASSNQMDIDNLEAVGALIAPLVTEDAVHAGLWDAAVISLFQVNWKDLTMGLLRQRDGWIGVQKVGRSQFTVELRGLMQAYSRSLGRLYVASCDAILGDSRCKVRLAPPVWQPTTAYTVATGTADASIGSIVSPSVPNGYIFYCGTAGTSGATEPTWTLASGGVTVDGTAVWESLPALTVVGALTGINTDNVTLYDTSRTEPGPTGGVAITNITNANPGVVTLASAATFFEQEVVVLSGILGPALLNVDTIIRALNLSANTFQLGVDTSDTSVYPVYTGGGICTPQGATSGWFDGGVIKFTSGANNGLSMEVKSYVPGQITLWEPLPNPLAIGDTYTMTAGCDKSPAACKLKFFNFNNYRGFPNVPGNDAMVQVGRSQ